MFYDNISRVLRWYKGRCSYEIRRININMVDNIDTINRVGGDAVGGKDAIMVDRDAINRVSTFSWQPRFHDHIIRNENELNRIREYIIKNPEMWERDRNNGDDLWL